jgi:hypothetical protein
MVSWSGCCVHDAPAPPPFPLRCPLHLFPRRYLSLSYNQLQLGAAVGGLPSLQCVPCFSLPPWLNASCTTHSRDQITLSPPPLPLMGPLFRPSTPPPASQGTLPELQQGHLHCNVLQRNVSLDLLGTVRQFYNNHSLSICGPEQLVVRGHNEALALDPCGSM